MRSEITKALETARRNKVIGHSLDAAVNIYAGQAEYAALNAVDEDLATILIVSKAHVTLNFDQTPSEAYRPDGMNLAILVTPAEGEKCERCWTYSDSVGHNSDHGTLCKRCSHVVSQLENA